MVESVDYDVLVNGVLIHVKSWSETLGVVKMLNVVSCVNHKYIVYCLRWRLLMCPV
jgi:hypothetical protein